MRGVILTVAADQTKTVLLKDGSLERYIEDDRLIELRDRFGNAITIQRDSQGNTQTITAPDGRTGIDLYRIRQADIRLVILDLSMPGLSGEETLNELCRINAQVPILLSSGYSQDEVAQRFAGQAAIGFIQKPYEISALIDEVKRRLAT